MADSPNQQAIFAASWATAAVTDLLDAAKALAAIGDRLADANRDPHPDYAFVRSTLDDAWKIVTDRALPNIARSQEKFVTAAQANHQVKLEAKKAEGVASG